MQNSILQNEQNHLDGVLKKLIDARNYLKGALDSLGAQNVDKLQELKDNPEASGADFMLFVNQLHEDNESFNVKDKIQRLEEKEYLLKEPYFARIDLELAEGEKKLYIGKFGFIDKDPVITDWRAKIASIYYRYRYPQKDVFYVAPEGKIKGDLTLKRTFEIEDGKLLKYFNNDIQLDESQIVAEKISQRTGGVLEDIVETIQEGQLDIIESDPRKVTVVQGCVGSGKSTVAIHKLSHIFFNFPEIITPQRSILIAKSGVLVSYLATLFPKLGIFDINYKTFRELVVNLMFREKISFDFDLDKNTDISGFGLSQIKELQDDINVVHNEVKDQIQKLVDSSEEFKSLSSFVYNNNYSVKENLDEFISDLTEELGYQKERIKDNPKSVKAWIFKDNISNLRKLTTKLKKMRTKLKEDSLKHLCTLWDIDTKHKLGYLDTLKYLFIHHALFGFGNTQKYQYCVVDEGQDFSHLEYYILNKLVINGRFCILGDLNQSYLDEGLTNWESISNIIDSKSSVETFELDTNYRSTKPIIDLANQILSGYTSKYLPKSINRIGEKPVIINCNTKQEIVNNLADGLEADLQNLDKSIGVISFDEELFELAQEQLLLLKTKYRLKDHDVRVLGKNNRSLFNPTAVYLTRFEDCKGLEFSKVYVLGAKTTNPSSFTEAKKHFVAVTRAMNEVVAYQLA